MNFQIIRGTPKLVGHRFGQMPEGWEGGGYPYWEIKSNIIHNYIKISQS